MFHMHRAVQITTWQRLTRPSSNEVPLLDGLRALSLVAVLLFHYWASLRHFARRVPDSVDVFLLNLNTGVVLFFVLSGFLISRGLYNEHRRTGEISFRSFYVKRTFRILPAYYFFLLFALLFIVINRAKVVHSTGILSPTADWYFDFLFISNYLPGIQGHTWTLSIEEQFYLLFPLLAAFLFKLRRDRLLLALVGIYLIPLAFRILSMVTLPEGEYAPHVDRASLTRFDDIIVGILLAVGGKELFPRKFTALIGLAGLTLTAIVLLLPAQVPDWFVVVRPNFTNLGFGAIVYWAIHREDVKVPKLVTAVARLSYSMYLWHMIAGAFGAGSVMHLIYDGTKIGAGPLLRGLLVSALATGLCGYLSYRFVEQPFLRLREKLETPPEDRKPDDPSTDDQDSQTDRKSVV